MALAGLFSASSPGTSQRVPSSHARQEVRAQNPLMQRGQQQTAMQPSGQQQTLMPQSAVNPQTPMQVPAANAIPLPPFGVNYFATLDPAVLSTIVSVQHGILGGQGQQQPTAAAAGMLGGLSGLDLSLLPGSAIGLDPRLAYGVAPTMLSLPMKCVSIGDVLVLF